MLALIKVLTTRRKPKSTGDQNVQDAKITREEMRDLFADVLTQKTAARR
jgi:hypothetical protein